VGLLGSLTTFSTFSLDSYILFKRQDFAILAIYKRGICNCFDMFFCAWLLGIKDW
jgi:fluoride ion exporter CrcB/FEX